MYRTYCLHNIIFHIEGIYKTLHKTAISMFQAAVAEAAARCATAGGLAPETPWRELLEDPEAETETGRTRRENVFEDTFHDF